MKHKNEAQDYYGTTGLLLLFIMIVSDLLFSGILYIGNAFYAIWIVLLIIDVPLLMVIAYFFINYFHFRNAQYINIQTVIFTSIDFSALARDRAALVGTAIVDGEEIRITTSYTFSTHYYSSHCASSYMDKTVTVGYDPKWDKWVVIEDK